MEAVCISPVDSKEVDSYLEVKRVELIFRTEQSRADPVCKQAGTAAEEVLGN